MTFTANETSNINLNCFVRGGTVDDIFVININNNRTVENLKDEIRNVRQDLHQRNFNLYKVDFYQRNKDVVDSVNDIEKGQGEFMESSFVNAQGESTDSQIEIFYYFPTLYMDRLRKKPYPQDGEKSPIHILIYHSGTDDPPEVGRVLQRNVDAQRNFGIEQVQTLITPD
ncbi:17665_t:CDS:2, partial [Acaulospora morrowiae]